MGEPGMLLPNKKVNLSQVFAGQKLGLKEVEENVWMFSLLGYDLGNVDLEEKTLEPLENPFHI